MEPQNEQIAPEIIQAIIVKATASGLSINEYLAQLIGLTNASREVIRTEAIPKAPVEEFMQAMESLGDENIQPLPLDFSREDIYLPQD